MKFVFVVEVFREEDEAKLESIRKIFARKATFSSLLMGTAEFTKPVIYRSYDDLKQSILKRQKLGRALSGIKHFKKGERFLMKLSAP